MYSCETKRKRRPLKHGSLYGLPITALKFFPFKDNELITASRCDIIRLVYFKFLHFSLTFKISFKTLPMSAAISMGNQMVTTEIRE